MKKLITTGLVALATLVAVAQSPAEQVILKAAKNQVIIVKQFPSIGNLVGFVISPKAQKNQKTIIYAAKDGQYMIAGSVIDNKGVNITQADYKKYVTDAMAPKVIMAAQKTSWFAQGNPNAPHQAYVIVEPNCIACHMLHQELMPLIKSGKLYVRWIMVAFLKPDSKAKAAAIFQAKDPAKALDTDQQNFNAKTEEGSIQPAKDIDAKSKANLKANFDFMQKYGFIATPVIIYKDSDGKAQITRGFAPGKALIKMVDGMKKLDS